MRPCVKHPAGAWNTVVFRSGVTRHDAAFTIPFSSVGEYRNKVASILKGCWFPRPEAYRHYSQYRAGPGAGYPGERKTSAQEELLDWLHSSCC